MKAIQIRTLRNETRIRKVQERREKSNLKQNDKRRKVRESSTEQAEAKNKRKLSNLQKIINPQRVNPQTSNANENASHHSTNLQSSFPTSSNSSNDKSSDKKSKAAASTINVKEETNQKPQTKQKSVYKKIFQLNKSHKYKKI